MLGCCFFSLYAFLVVLSFIFGRSKFQFSLLSHTHNYTTDRISPMRQNIYSLPHVYPIITKSGKKTEGFTCVRSNVIFSHLHVGLQSSDAKACHRCQQNFVNSLSCGSLSTFRSSTSRLHVGKPTCAYKSTLLFSVTTYHEQSETEDPLEADVNPTQKYSWADIKKPRICILGGGFGGLYTALRLESLVWPADKKPQILIIDQFDRFVFKPMMYELLSKEVDIWEIAPRFEDLLKGTNIKFQQDRVKKVFPYKISSSLSNGSFTSEDIGGCVALESGLEVEYDWLLLALGAESRRDIVPGAVEYALPFSSLEDVLEIDRQLKELEREKFGADKPPINLVVVGAGYCGVELAATLAERLGDRGKVQIVDVSPDICTSAPAGNREAAYKVLSSRGVELIMGVFASAIKKSTSNESGFTPHYPYSLELKPANKTSKQPRDSSITLMADMVFWTVGSKPVLPPEIEGNGSRPFPVNGRGQVEVDDTLRVKGYPRVFAIGDSTYLRNTSNQPLPATAQVAFQESDYCGWNLWAAINNQPLLPFRYQNLGEMMTLGRNDAAVTVSFVDGVTLEGSLGHAARKLAYLYRLPTNEHRVKVGLSWFVKSAVDTLASVQDTLTKLASNPT